MLKIHICNILLTSKNSSIKKMISLLYSINVCVFCFFVFFRCSSTESRVAAYDLLTELANKCLANLEHICKHLIRMHHLPNPECSNEWEVSEYRTHSLSLSLSLSLSHTHTSTTILICVPV